MGSLVICTRLLKLRQGAIWPGDTHLLFFVPLAGPAPKQQGSSLSLLDSSTAAWPQKEEKGTAQFSEDGADNSFDYYKSVSCLSLHLVIPLQVASTAELMGNGSILKAEKRTVCAGGAGDRAG